MKFPLTSLTPLASTARYVVSLDMANVVFALSSFKSLRVKVILTSGPSIVVVFPPVNVYVSSAVIVEMGIRRNVNDVGFNEAAEIDSEKVN